MTKRAAQAASARRAALQNACASRSQPLLLTVCKRPAPGRNVNERVAADHRGQRPARMVFPCPAHAGAFRCRRRGAMRGTIQERGAHERQRASAAKGAKRIVGIGVIILTDTDGRWSCPGVRPCSALEEDRRDAQVQMPAPPGGWGFLPTFARGRLAAAGMDCRAAHCGYNDRQKQPCPGENPDRAVLCNVMVKAVAPPALPAPAAGQAAPSPPWVWDAPGRRLAPAAAALP